ncbi:acetylcholine receptor subunit beta [Culicoides brevitarsis]|uniref:acetylcholine receptor subunit beta n=1 Tax=Culicoides brevitarsis TaxID=469753 RepID=UPI00307B4723
MFWILIFYTISLSAICGAAGGKYNITYEQLDRCKEYDAVNGYNYRTYFHLSDLKHATPKDEELVNINLVILGTKDAHILLTSSKDDVNAPVYEIVIGAGSNTFCEIRKKRKTGPLKNKRVQVLSPIDPVPLTIRITRSGIIEVTIRGDILPLISAEDTQPITDLKYISFSSWGSTSIRFFYDCPDFSSGQELTPEEPPMTTQEKLIQKIFKNYDIFTLPQLQEEVMIDSFTIKSVNYDEKKSLLTSRVNIKLSWNDSRLMWDPEDFESIKGIRNPSKGSFWKPSLMLMNGALAAFKDLDIQYSFSVNHDGTVNAESKDFEINTLCFPQRSFERHDWPLSEMTCSIQLMTQTESLAGFESSIKLKIETESAWIVTAVAEDDDYVANHLPFIEFERIVSLDEQPKTQRMCVTYNLTLKQNQEYFQMLFRVPLFVSIACLALSTVTRKMLRFSFISVGFLILCFSFISLSDNAPTFYKSTFAIHHETLMYLSLVSLVLAIVNIWCFEYPPDTLPPLWMGQVVNFHWLRIFLGLQNTGGYDFLQKRKLAWQELDEVLDRLWLLSIIVYGTICMSTA